MIKHDKNKIITIGDILSHVYNIKETDYVMLHHDNGTAFMTIDEIDDEIYERPVIDFNIENVNGRKYITIDHE